MCSCGTDCDLNQVVAEAVRNKFKYFHGLRQQEAVRIPVVLHGHEVDIDIFPETEGV